MTVCLASFTSGLCLREDGRGLEVTWGARTDFVSHSKELMGSSPEVEEILLPLDFWEMWVYY